MFKIFVVVMALVNGDAVMDQQTYTDRLNTFSTEAECEAHRTGPEFQARVDNIAEGVNDAYRQLYPYSKQSLDVRINTSCRDTPGNNT